MTLLTVTHMRCPLPDNHGGAWSHSMSPRFLDFTQRWTGRPERSLLVCVCMRAKSMWPPLRSSDPAGTLGLAGCSSPWGREGSRCISKPATGWCWGHVYKWGRGAYDLRSLLHILKLTSEYLSMLHQLALLTPKSGLWEKSNWLLWVTLEPGEW